MTNFRPHAASPAAPRRALSVDWSLLPTWARAGLGGGALVFVLTGCTGNIGQATPPGQDVIPTAGRERDSGLGTALGDAGRLPPGVDAAIPPGVDAGVIVSPTWDSGRPTGPVVDSGVPGLTDSGAPTMTPVDSGRPPQPDAGPVNNCDETSLLASSIRITEVAFYQAVKVPVMQDGQAIAPADRKAPIVQRRPGLVRVFVEPQSGWQAHEVTAVLTLTNGAESKTYRASATMSATSTDASGSSTFNLSFEADAIGSSSQYSVALVESDCDGSPGRASDARFPATGTAALNAAATGRVHVVIVPFDYRAAGGSIIPDTSQAVQDSLRDAFFAEYPVEGVDVSVRSQPLVYNGTISRDGSGWETALSALRDVRAQDNPPSNVFYYGIVNPAATNRQYCGTSCAAGLAPVVTSGRQGENFFPREHIGLGLGYEGAINGTAVHELGHAHGREHAPCQVSPADANYPYSGGSIGSWGFDIRSNELLSPSQYTDVMGYCNRVWVSDYTYHALARRVAAIYGNEISTALSLSTSGEPWKMILVHMDGSASWSATDSEGMPPGELVEATVLDDAGQEIQPLTVYELPLGDSAARFLYVPSPEPTWATLVMPNRTLRFDEISQPE